MPPAHIEKMGETDFDRIAYEAHDRFGPVTAEGLNRMLESVGF